MPQFGRQASGRQARRRIERSLLQTLLTLGILAIIGVVLAACAGVNDSGTHPEFVETQAAARASEEGGQGGHGEGEASPEASPGSTEATGGEATEPAGGNADLVAEGQNLAASNACIGCHSTNGSALVGPTWQGLYGHEVTLEDGSTATADDAYIAESIRDPSAKVVQGFPDVMPKTYANWSDDQIAAIIAYIQSLD